MKRSGPASALVIAALLLGGCSSEAVSMTSGPVAAAVPAAGASLSASDFAAAARLQNTILLDVRTPSEFAEGHITGAVNLDLQSANFTQGVAALDASKTYAVYCRSGQRSKAAMAAMQQHGIARLFDLAGGITAWKSAGGQVVTG